MPATYLQLDFLVTDGRPTQRSRDVASAAARAHSSRVFHMKKKADRVRSRSATEDADELDPTECEGSPEVRPLRKRKCLLSNVSAHVPYVVNWFTAVNIPNVQPVFEIFQVEYLCDKAWLCCLASEPYHSAFAATVQLNGEISDPSTFNGEPSISVLQHNLRAIHALREQLAYQNQPDTSMLLAMLQLGFTEARLGNLSHFDMHRAAVGNVLEHERGSEVSTTIVNKFLAAYDLYRAMEGGAHPPIGTRVCGPQVLGDVLEQIASPLLQQIPSGFRRLAENGKLPLEVVRVIHRVTSVSRKLNHSDQHSTDSSRPHSAYVTSGTDVQDEDQKLHSSFWSACPSLLPRSTDPRSEPEIGNMMSLALWLYANLEFSVYPAWRTIQDWISMPRWVRRDLTNKLLRCVQERPEDEEDGLKWLFIMAIESWRGADNQLLSLGIQLYDARNSRYPMQRQPSATFFEYTKGRRGEC